jgi:hypothetical protein
MARQKKEQEMTVAESEVEAARTELDLARQELEKTKAEIEAKKKELSAPRQLDANEKKIDDNRSARVAKNKALERKIEDQKRIDDTPITGRFMNRRAPGQSVKLTYMKYDTDPVKWYVFEDGKVYTIPRGFADQLNDYYHSPVFMQKDGELDPSRPNSVIQEVDKSNKKYAFVPTGF